jgi:hypothetical protein
MFPGKIAKKKRIKGNVIYLSLFDFLMPLLLGFSLCACLVAIIKSAFQAYSPEGMLLL